jgi:very-short-patch-repair endonuclease
MRRELLALAEQHDVVTRAQLRSVARDHVIEDAVTAGALTPVFPGVYALPDRAGTRICRQNAAITYTGGALSHTDGLQLHGLVPEIVDPIHVTVSGNRGPIRLAGLVVHRRRDFVAEPPLTVIRGGLVVVRIEQAIIESWPMLAPFDRRSPIITALRERRTTEERVSACLEANPRAAGAREIREVARMIVAGCHSELELWGHTKVLSDKRLPRSRAQVRMVLPSGVVYLDRYFDAEMVAVELDGAAWHGSPAQRERDVRRDAQLAALGIVVVRFTHQRLHREPDRVIEELLSILAARRCQLAS